jgi:hypothetical protein
MYSFRYYYRVTKKEDEQKRKLKLQGKKRGSTSKMIDDLETDK